MSKTGRSAEVIGRSAIADLAVGCRRDPQASKVSIDLRTQALLEALSCNVHGVGPDRGAREPRWAAERQSHERVNLQSEPTTYIIVFAFKVIKSINESHFKKSVFWAKKARSARLMPKSFRPARYARIRPPRLWQRRAPLAHLRQLSPPGEVSSSKRNSNKIYQFFHSKLFNLVHPHCPALVHLFPLT